MRLSLAVAVVAAGAAALAAHAGIDALGDVVLAHDAYDDVAHASRALVCAPLFAAVLLAAGAIAFFAARQARAHGTPLRGFLQALAPRSPLPFAIAVALLTPAGVAAMGAFDAFAAGHVPDDIAEVLAGAPAFAIAVAIVTGLFTGLAGACGLRALACAEGAIVGCLIAGRRLPRLRLTPHVYDGIHPLTTAAARTPLLTQRRPSRAPPGPTR